MKLSPPLSATLLRSRWLLPTAVAGAVGAGWLAGRAGVLVPGVLLAGTVLLFVLVLVFRVPRAGFIICIGYCFLISFLSRHLVDVSVGLATEGLLLVTWLAVFFYRSDAPDWRRIQNSLCLLSLIWFIINLLELGNPAEASLEGWYYEVRGTSLVWVLVVPLGCLLFKRKRDLNLFLYLTIGLSLVGALYGIKQKVLGVDEMEQLWLDQGGGLTHLIWGQLRVFSSYSDAAQFGCSQAHLALICLILAVGPFTWQKRLLLAGTGLLLVYGMLISGTRSAFFVLVAGGFVYLTLSNRGRVLLLGCVLAAGIFFTLKYTTLGNSNQSIFRMRTALDPNDPSLLVRLNNQAVLREYLATRPFGGGVGVMGYWGTRYNPDKFLSTIPPDSYFVKVWGEYGIVGFVVWLGIMLFILGKCAGIIWRIRDPVLRQKLLALTAGFGGILAASYGNEIINQMPSAIIVYVSWVFVFLGPSLDTPSSDSLALAPNAHA